MYGYLPDPKSISALRDFQVFRRVHWFVLWPGLAGMVGMLVTAWLQIIVPPDTNGEVVNVVFLLTLFAVSLFLVVEGIASVVTAHAFMGVHLKAGTIRKVDPRIRRLKVRHDGSRLVPVTDADRFELQRLQDEHFLQAQREGGYRAVI